MNNLGKDLQDYSVRVGNFVVLACEDKIAVGQVKEIRDKLIGIKISKIYNEDPPSDLIWVESDNVYMQ